MKSKLKNKIIEFIGWIGVFFVILSYALSSFNVINSNQVIYYIIVLMGATGAFILTYHKKIYQSAIINIIVATFAVFGIIRIIYLHH